MDKIDMLKALYDFQAVYPKTISFDEGEYFILYQTSARQRNWWQVVSMKGNIGFVPSNYVMKIKVEPDFLISFLNSSIESLEKSSDAEINGVISKDELLVRLREKKNSLERVYSDNTDLDIDSSLSFSQSLSEHFPSSKSRLSIYGQSLLDSDLQGQLLEGPTGECHEQKPSSAGLWKAAHNNRLDVGKKSVSSPSMGAMVPALLQESVSMGSIQVQQQQQQQGQHPITQSQLISTSAQQSKASEIAQDNSIASEPSTTTTTTSEDVVTTYREPSLKDLSAANSNNLQMEGTGAKEEEEIAHTMNQKTNYRSPQSRVEEAATGNANVEEDYSENSEEDHSFHQRQAVLPNQRRCNGGEECPVADTSTSSISGTQRHQEEEYPVWPERQIHSSDVYQIVDAIRRNTNSSFGVSCEALRVVLTSMEQLFNGHINPYLEAIAIHVTGKVKTPKELLGLTHDARRLQGIFAQLAECKNDSQQRSWMVYEDEEDIVQFLEELVEILDNGDEVICCHELASDQYQVVVNLVQYYQMETRWPIKRLLLHAFSAACYLDAVIVDILVTSVLPLEIVEDIKVQCDSLERLRELVKVLTLILSLGQPLPINHQDYLGSEFAKFLLKTIESHNSESFIDLIMALLLAFNLQFLEPADNPIIEALEVLDTVKVFTEKILLLLNREDDPVKLLKHTGTGSLNSVLKLFIDIFSRKKAANIFYTTDNKVLIDIVVRQLTDLCAGNPLRRCYLELCRGIMRHTNYAEHQHRKQDFMKIFTRIFCEDAECSAGDQQLVRDIANEFPLLFKA